MPFKKLVKKLPFMEIFKIVNDARPFKLKPYSGFESDYLNADALEMDELSLISGWKHLKECILMVRIPKGEWNENPPEYGDFRDKFVRLADENILPGLIEDWKQNLSRLEKLEITANMYVDAVPEDDDNEMPFPDTEEVRKPLVFAVRCGMEKLHFYFR